MVPADADDISKEYEILVNELKKYNPELLDKNRLLAISKSDLLDDELKEEIIVTLPNEIEALFISSISQNGIQVLKDKLWDKINYDPFKNV